MQLESAQSSPPPGSGAEAKRKCGPAAARLRVLLVGWRKSAVETRDEAELRPRWRLGAGAQGLQGELGRLLGPAG